jgi:hypothetical protein
MRLIVLPCDPRRALGYNRAAARDLARLGERPDDRRVVYLEPGIAPPPGWGIIPRPTAFSPRRGVNLLRRRPMTETFAQDLRPFVVGHRWSDVFCGDVIFFRALRELLPAHEMVVRFHNYFTLCGLRQTARRYPIGLRFAEQLRVFTRLEAEIVADPKVHPIFINPAERELFNLQWPGRAADVWGVDDPLQAPAKAPSEPRLIYLGSTAGHQAFGIRMLAERVFPMVRQRIKEAEFHLWGSGTERFHDPARAVFGHGFRADSSLPFEGNGLFVIPDLLGGGIKIKMGDAIARGRAFITTPFGAEGYVIQPDPNVIIADFETWPNAIVGFFSRFEPKSSELAAP